jgi:hypothetical protein
MPQLQKHEATMMIARYKQAWWLGLLALMSCDVINPAEDIPGYIYVPEFRLTVSPGLHGSASERITDVWLNVDGDFLGAYTLPALIPILEMGERELVLQAGIKENGINSTPDIYPFYNDFRLTFELKPNEVDTIRPSIRYSDFARFAFIEDFESSSQIFQDVRLGRADQLQISNAEVFEGTASGHIRLDSLNPVLEVATTVRFNDLITRDPRVFLELNYKSEVPVVFGIIGNRPGGLPSNEVVLFEPGFLPREDWNKIYFNLSTLIIEANQPEIQVVLQAFIPIADGSFSRSQANVWLDNIKLLHF